MFLYKDILRQSWRTTWKNKYLWFFGLFAALITSGGDIDIFFKALGGSLNSGFLYRTKELFATLLSGNFIANVSTLNSEELFSLFTAFVILLIIIALSIFLLWLSVVSQVAIINNMTRSYTGKGHDFNEGISAGMKKFWPVLGLNLILKAGVMLLLLVLGLPFVLDSSRWAYTLIFLVLVPLIMSLSFIIKYATCYVVIKDNTFMAGIKEAWSLFIKNWLVTLEMAVILFLVYFAVTLLLFILLTALIIPLAFVFLSFTNLAQYFGFWFIMLSSFILIILVIALVGSVLFTFQISSWTTLFIELVGRGGVSKLVRTFSRSK